jgi:hypothetical protein
MPFSQITVGTTSVLLFAYNRQRSAWIIENNGATNLYISEDNPATTTKGMRLSSGAVFTENATDGDDTTLAIYIVSDAAGGDVRIYEGYGVGIRNDLIPDPSKAGR